MTKVIRLKRKKRTVGKPLTRNQSRYRFQPDFAADIKEKSLETYRKSKGKDFELSGNTVLMSLDFCSESAEILPVMNTQTGKMSKMPVVRLTELAKLLNTTYQTIWRWSSDTEQLPAPILVEKTQGRERPVYHLKEVEAMIRILGEHLNEFRYYRKSHTGTLNKLFSGIETIRQANFGDTTNGNSKSRKAASHKRN